MRRARLARGWSREALAERAGLHCNTVGIAERGDRDLSSISETRILLALGCERLCITREGFAPVLCANPDDARILSIRALPDAVVARYIGTAIRKRRVALGLSLDDVAARATLHRNTLWNIERGFVLASSLSLYRIYLVLGTSALVPCAERLELE